MLPENERILTGQVTSEDSQRVCEHSSVFMATPGADQIIEQERLELQLRKLCTVRSSARKACSSSSRPQ